MGLNFSLLGCALLCSIQSECGVQCAGWEWAEDGRGDGREDAEVRAEARLRVALECRPEHLVACAAHIRDHSAPAAARALDLFRRRRRPLALQRARIDLQCAALRGSGEKEREDET